MRHRNPLEAIARARDEAMAGRAKQACEDDDAYTAALIAANRPARAERRELIPVKQVCDMAPNAPPRGRMNTYRVEADVTISVSTMVEAKSMAEAIRIAEQRGLASIHEPDPDETTEWVTSGELDGEPTMLVATEEEP